MVFNGPSGNEMLSAILKICFVNWIPLQGSDAEATSKPFENNDEVFSPFHLYFAMEAMNDLSPFFKVLYRLKEQYH